MISTRNLTELPSAEELQLRLQEMAALEAVFAVDYGESVYEFHPKWAGSQRMGAVKNASGDELFVHFTSAGCFIKGFAHESAMTPFRTKPPTLWPRLLENVPFEFEASLNEPAFDMPSTTFVVWRLSSDERWQTSDVEYPEESDPDGSTDLLSRLLLNSGDFANWLAEHYEVEFDAEIVTHVFRHEPLSDAQLRLLNVETSLSSLRKAVESTGYELT